MKSRLIVIAVPICMLLTISTGLDSRGEDWPTWRHDAGRTAASSEQLPSELHLQWTLALPALKPAWPEDSRLQFDASYEPIVVGRTMFLGSSHNDSLSAYDLDTGARRWRFFADGPVRFAPVASESRLFFGADDGSFYCLEADSGKLIWKFRAAPAGRRAIGNERLISVWPMRGGPVVSNGRVYFTAGVWPFEGTLLYSLDAASGDLLDVEGQTDAVLPRSQYTSTNLNNLAPQGYLVASGNRLFVPCGRATVFGVDLSTGKRSVPKYDSRGLTDYHVVASDNWLFHGDKVVNLVTGKTPSISALRPVVQQEFIYFAREDQAFAYDLKNQIQVEKKDRRGQTIKVMVPRQLWKLENQPITKVHIKAGNRLYAHHGKDITAIETSSADAAAKVAWKTTLDGVPSSMLAANGKLIVVTKEGSIHCFGGKKVDLKKHSEGQLHLADSNEHWQERTASILRLAGTDNGYCISLGIGTGKLIEELLRQSQMRIVVVDPDSQRVESLRRELDDRGLYGSRVVIHAGIPLEASFPPYMANLVVSEDLSTLRLRDHDGFVTQVFHALRPYGGTAYLPTSPIEHSEIDSAVAKAKLPASKVSRADDASIVQRVGALPGSADWTHEFGDPANSLMSREKLVKAPLGVLWFGGAASDGSLFYDRHEWGPSMAVVEGRMFIQGPGKLTAVDVYTGRILWQNEIPEGKSPGRGSNWGPTGYHFVAEKDGVYLTYPQKCLRLDPATGKQVAEFTLEDKDDRWGRIRISGDQMFVPVFRQTEAHGPRPNKLVALDRDTGKQLWSQETELSFPLVAIGNGKVFCYEGLLEGLYVGASKDRVNGIPKAEPFLNVKAFNANSGKELWERTTPRVASWLAYSEDHDVLLVSNKTGIEGWRGKSGKELWNKKSEGVGFRGHPENYWDKVILWKDRILDQRGPGKAYDVRTGKPIMHTHPITGQNIPWEFTKDGHHCNYAIASEHLMTFRAAAAGFLDLESGGTARLEGFRSGCRNSLIPANGVLNAPNFAHGCSCSYSIFTSLALVHVPQSDLWTYSAYKLGDGPVKRFGINLGAAGDRRADNDTLWLDYPSRGGASPDVAVNVSTDKPEWFRVHTAQISGDGPKWIAASGVRGVKSITIPLVNGKVNGAVTERPYTVRLYFAEPKETPIGANVFDVTIQGQKSLTDFDIVKEAGGAQRMIMRESAGILAAGNLTVALAATRGQTILCGIEVVADDTASSAND